MSTIKDKLRFGAGRIFSKSLEWVDKGFTLIKVDKITQLHRITLCEGCPNFNAENRACNLCTCPMDFKTSLKFEPIKGIVKKEEIKCADKENPRW